MKRPSPRQNNSSVSSGPEKKSLSQLRNQSMDALKSSPKSVKVNSKREGKAVWDSYVLKKSLQGYNYEFNPRLYVSSELTELDVMQIKEVFDSFDFDKNGIITPNDIRNALEKYGFNASRQTVYDIVAEYDDDESGGLSFKEFIQIMTKKGNRKETQADVMRVFRKFDKGNKGFVNLSDLKRAAVELQEEIEEDVLVEMLKRSDLDMDGKISFEDFYNVITKKVYY